MRARPLRVLKRALDERRLGQLAHAYGYDFRGRNPQGHLVLDEVDDEQFELSARNLLLLDRDDLADPMGRIDDKLVSFEALSLRSLFIASHSGHDSFAGPFSGTGHLGCGSPTADCTARGVGGPPHCSRLFGSAAHAGGAFLCFMTRFSCHCSRVDRTPSKLETVELSHRKIMLPNGGAHRWQRRSYPFFLYIAHF